MSEQPKPTAVLQDIAAFDAKKLNSVTPEEKVVLPSSDRESLFFSDMTQFLEIAQEKVMEQIANPETIQLKHTETVEKNVLPTKEDIQAEKAAA
ncbi:hypothetical protein Ciccas_010501 [Cichlidogyrus casuarinus]|uniref:Uncharacterized protein n=1 Tax=Cichlidogyrus casuarinus TaxID=1844966 RepID=A0ABD2PTY2_9PLAT